ncbi:uncharacterized protein F5Z01DRAFT_677570 [Emericellopsis atlantica]|uniref:Mg2+ transporter protein, CorA-like/Zinc transport protein ZntB n=1 Tax=Emericellopsis atlantica TaxID=2614577 RepID=A0A9P7ZES0_9HYPO|nr:uncharacterized protein F5Z01DRAFT_677570 [Emericellopsis atlantica]KAG9250749.1 hypothetical protein F5Z01DRAFT_677570 [Emericellopsis atlantica]
MPQFWWSEHNKNASGHFGCESHGIESEGGSSVVSWLRLQVKVQNDVHKYYWYKINMLVDWRSSGATKIVLFDPKPQVSEKIAAKLLINVPKDKSHLKDPFWVYGQVFEDLIAVQDTSVWQIRDLTREAETRKDMGEGLTTSVTYFDTLHNILRHATHSMETLQTSIKTIHSIMSSHETLGARFAQVHTEETEEQRHILDQADWARAKAQRDSVLGNETADTQGHDIAQLEASGLAAVKALTDGKNAERDRRSAFYHNEEKFRYYENFFESTLGRAMANKERLTNQIQLEFNKVTKADSDAMKTVAFVTLLFLPATFVAAIFSTTFSSSNGGEWMMSGKFWIYWAFAIPITFLTALLWTLWRYRGKLGRLYEQRRERAEKEKKERQISQLKG